MFPEFIERIITRIFGVRRLVDVVLYPYTGCDVLCKHCSDIEKFTNQTMTVELVEKLLRQAKWRWLSMNIVLMGTGEPLLCSNFVPIMEKLSSSPLVNLVKLVTSGFTKKEKEKKERFQQLLNLDNFRKCIISHSFNLFHESFPERMVNAIEAMFACHEKFIIKVGMAVTVENADKTLDALQKALNKIDIGESYGVHPLVVGKEILDEYIVERQLSAIFNFQEMGNRFKYLSLTPQVYAIRGETMKAGVKAIPFPVQNYGRGKCVGEKLFGNERCNTFIDTKEQPPHVIIGPDGECYPDINCFNIPHMSLGNLNKEKISVILTRQQKLLENLVADVLKNSDKNLSICEAHQAACKHGLKRL